MTSLPIALFCSIFHISRFPLFVPCSSFPRSLVTSYRGRGNIRHKIRKADIIPKLLFCSLFKFPCIYQQIVCTQYTAHEKKKNKTKQNNSNKTKLTRRRPRNIQITPFHHAVPLNSSVCFQPSFFTNKSTVSHFSLFFYLAHWLKWKDNLGGPTGVFLISPAKDLKLRLKRKCWS